MKEILTGLLNRLFYFYNLLIKYLYLIEDKQRRSAQKKKENFDPNSFEGRMKKLGWKINYFITKKRFSLKEQKDLMITLRSAVKYKNDIQMPFKEMQKRGDLRPFVRLSCGEIARELAFHPLYSILEDKNVLHHEYVALIKVAYKTGEFIEAYDKIIESLQDKLKRRNAFLMIMFQPILTLIVALACEVFVALYLVPELIGNIEESQIKGVIKSYYNLQDILMNHKLEYGLKLGLVAVIIYYFFKIPATKYLIDLLLLQVPMISKYIIQWEISKFFSSTNDMFKSKASLQESLGVSIGLISNKAIKSSILKDIEEHTSKTSDLSRILADSVYVEYRVRNQLKVATNSGASPQEILDSIVDEYKDSMKILMETPMQLIIPMMITVAVIYMFTRLVPLFTEVSTIMQNIGT